jgi:hypothetical protein
MFRERFSAENMKLLRCICFNEYLLHSLENCMTQGFFQFLNSRVADPHPDPSFHSNTDPDLASQNNAD